MPEHLNKSVVVVTATEVIYTGKLSWMFIYKSALPREIRDEKGGKEWGHLLYDDPARKSVFINTFDDTGFKMSWGNEELTLQWLLDLLKNFPEKCTLLLDREHVELFKEACEKLDIELYVHRFEGVLRSE